MEAIKPEQFKHVLFIGILIISLLTSGGCFDIKREIKMNPDGSGMEEMYVTLDKELLDKLGALASADVSGKWKKKLDSINDNGYFESNIRADVMKVGGISLKDLVVTANADGSKQVYMKYHFDEPTVLVKMIKEGTFRYSNQLPVQFSTIKFLDEESNLTFKHVTRKAERSFSDELMQSYLSPLYSSHKVTYTIDFPFNVKESNATGTAGNSLTWEMTMENAITNQQTDTAGLVKDPTLELTYAERVDRTVGKVSQKENPLIRVQVYNRNKEPVKIGTGIVLKDGLIVTNFKLMNLIEGAGFFSVILPSDSLAGIDEMTDRDLDKKQDLVYLRFGSADKFKPFRYASTSSAKYGDKVKLYYYPNTLSSVVYSMGGVVSGTKKWTSKTGVIEIKPSKPISLEGGAVFNEAGELLGMVTQLYEGEVGRIYLVPAEYIKAQIPR
jgi:hypothetical protein